MKHISSISFFACTFFLCGLTVALAKPLSPRPDWRVTPINVNATTNALLIYSNMVTGVDAAFSVPSASGWVSVEIPVSTQTMMLTFAAAHGLEVSADESFDSTNGLNGMWSPLTPTLIRPLETATRQQRLDIDPGASRWIRLHLTNSSAGNLSITNIGLYEYDSDGNDDYWLFLGASIQQGSVRHSEFKQHVKDRFGYDPVVFNEGVNGWTSGNLRTELSAILARHPRARFVAIHIGGNDVTNVRPYPTGAGPLYSNIVTILQSVINSNMIPVPARLSFRSYNSDPVVDTFNNPLSETNGSGPYVTAIYDPLILQYTPDFYDNTNNRGVVDMYTYFFTHQDEISGDGIHLIETGRQSWNRLWANLAGSVIYDDLVAPALSGAVTLNASNVIVTFSEEIESISASTATNYTVDHGINVLSATLGPESHQVTLLTSTMTNSLLYTLTVNNITDLEANVIAPDATTTFTFIDPAADITVLFDLGSTNLLTTGNWNNVTLSSTGMRITNAVAADGGATTIDFSITDNFVANNSVGIATNILYPSTAQQDTLYIEAPANSQAVIRISGLYTNILYDFSFFASRSAAGVTNRVGIYKIGLDTFQMNAADNRSNRFTLAAIAPDVSGNVDITIQVAPGSTFAYLGVLEVSTADTNSGEDVAPPELNSAAASSDTNVVVTFSEALSVATSGTTTNYTITPGITVFAAAPGPSTNSVTLTTSLLSTGVVYTLTVNHVQDLSGNFIAPDATAMFTYIAPPPPATGDYVSILFDLGSVATPSTGNWNNVTSTGSGAVTNAVDANGNNTPIGYQTVTSFQGINSQGVINDSLYPATAQQDTFFLRSTGFTQAIVRITGLATNETYTFLFFASRSTAGNRKTDYIIGGTTVQLEASDNTTNRVSIAGVIPPPTGDVDITVRISPDQGAGEAFGYLGVLEVRAFAPGSGEDADTDGDGIPDWWEEQYGGGPTNVIASADDDTDGFDNISEWIANTDPTDDESYFAVAEFHFATGTTNRVLTWSSASGRVYSVLGSTNLLTPMITITSNLPATTPLNSYTITVSETSAEVFRSLRVHLP
jgi:lysophospholipase L1-like esterase